MEVVAETKPFRVRPELLARMIRDRKPDESEEDIRRRVAQIESDVNTHANPPAIPPAPTPRQHIRPIAITRPTPYQPRNGELVTLPTRPGRFRVSGAWGDGWASFDPVNADGTPNPTQFRFTAKIPPGTKPDT